MDNGRAGSSSSRRGAAVSGSAAFCTASAISREASAPIGVISAADFVPPVSVRSVTSTGVSASFSPAARPTAARAISYTPKKCFISAAAQHSAQTQGRLNTDYASTLAAKVQELKEQQRRDWNSQYLTAVSASLGTQTSGKIGRAHV